MEITIKTNTPLEEELLALFSSLDIDGQAEVLATAYKEKIRLKGLSSDETLT